MVRLSCVLTLLALAIVGCESRPAPSPEPAKGSQIKINDPAVNVEVDGRKGKVKVDAPGVKIDVQPK